MFFPFLYSVSLQAVVPIVSNMESRLLFISPLSFISSTNLLNLSIRRETSSPKNDDVFATIASSFLFIMVLLLCYVPGHHSPDEARQLPCSYSCSHIHRISVPIQKGFIVDMVLFQIDYLKHFVTGFGLSFFVRGFP